MQIPYIYIVSVLHGLLCACAGREVNPVINGEGGSFSERLIIAMAAAEFMR